MSATGESDTRNYYDMISSRQEIDLRPKLERLDDLVLRSAGLDPAALSFEFRPLWQMDASASATIALQKAQATQIYAGLNLWPASVTAKLVEAQLAEDGTYPGAETIFAEAPVTGARSTTDFNFNPAQLRDPGGQWSRGGGGPHAPDGTAISFVGHREEEEETTGGSPPDPVEELEGPSVALVPNLLRKLPGYNAPVSVYPPLVAEPIVPRSTAPPSGSPPAAGSPAPAPAASSTLSSSPAIPASVGPGPFARESIPAGPTPRPSSKQQQDINTLFQMYGCHS